MRHHASAAARLPAVTSVSLLLWGLLLSGGCSKDEARESAAIPAPLGVQVTARGAPGIDPDLSEAYETVIQGGFAFAQFALEWGAVESSGESQDWGTVDLHRVQAVRQGTPLSIELLLVDHGVRGRLPSDLDGDHFAAWDDSILTARLAGFLRSLEMHLRPVRLTDVWLGRDVDSYFAHHRDQVAAFCALLSACRDSLALDHLDVGLGSIVSYGDALEAGSLDIGDALAAATGRLGLTVYGRNRDFVQTLDASATAGRVSDALARFPSARVVLCEVGLPAADDGGQSAQAEFAARVTAFLSNPPSNLEKACWFCLNDWHVDKGKIEAQRLFPEETELQQNVCAQLGSLGLRAVNGVPKPAWSVLRGWNQSLAPVASGAGIMQY
jgi:hypothetical protein